VPTDIFEWLAELGQLVETGLDHTRGPRVDLVLLVRIVANGALDRLLDYVAHLVDNERGLLGCQKLTLHRYSTKKK
jgi:hypothetical protein